MSNRWRVLSSLIAGGLVAVVLGACGGGGGETPASATLLSIAVTPANPSIAKGNPAPFAATGTYSDASTRSLTATATWSSSTTSVATISNAVGSKGEATTVAVGTSSITASLGGISGSTTLTVTPPTLASIVVTPANPSVSVGATQPFTATGTFTDGSTHDVSTTVTWSSATGIVASVSNVIGSSGLATALAVGSTDISATSGMVSGSTTLSVTAPTATYTYYSLTSLTPQTATLSSNGTLTMGTLTLTNFTFGGSATDPSGTLTSWASPGSSFNQPVVQAMLFCGTNGKLAYVLVLSATADPSRAASTATNLVGAIAAAPQYDGMSIYTDCTNYAYSAWNNNRPSANFYLWPNVIATYSAASVANQLTGAVIFHEAGTPSNQHNYLAITRGGASPFEVWQ
jgi:hypothetical protein